MKKIVIIVAGLVMMSACQNHQETANRLQQQAMCMIQELNTKET